MQCHRPQAGFTSISLRGRFQTPSGVDCHLRCTASTSPRSHYSRQQWESCAPPPYRCLHRWAGAEWRSTPLPCGDGRRPPVPFRVSGDADGVVRGPRPPDGVSAHQRRAVRSPLLQDTHPHRHRQRHLRMQSRLGQCSIAIQSTPSHTRPEKERHTPHTASALTALHCCCVRCCACVRSVRFRPFVGKTKYKKDPDHIRVGHQVRLAHPQLHSNRRTTFPPASLTSVLRCADGA